MSDMFYSVPCGTKCRCGKPAINEIRRSGGDRYDHTCDRCTSKRIKELAKVHGLDVRPSTQKEGNA